MNDRFKFRAWIETGLHSSGYFIYNLEEDVTCFWEMIAVGVDHPIMQCTGLKDKNAKLIYEGDILRRDKKRGHETKIVQWESKHFCNAGWNIGPKLGYRDITGWEIIGNIHQTPELIKAK